MKLWRKTTKRLAKKESRYNWRKLNLARHLKPGDLISTCKGYNEEIAEIKPCWSGDGKIVVDFDIITVSGSGHSVFHCCTLPLETREEIGRYHLAWLGPEELEERRRWTSDGKLDDVTQALLDGVPVEDIWDELGRLRYEYCRDYERKAVYPERYRLERGDDVQEEVARN